VDILSFIGNIFKPAADLIDNVHTSSEEKLALKNELSKIQSEATLKVIDLQSQLLLAQKDIIVAEAQGGPWIQKSWRPVTMLTFLGLVVLDSFGWLASPLAKEAWTLLQIGLGGYVVGRSIEKTAKRK
jgi:hypothetical protein